MKKLNDKTMVNVIAGLAAPTPTTSEINRALAAKKVANKLIEVGKSKEFAIKVGHKILGKK